MKPLVRALILTCLLLGNATQVLAFNAGTRGAAICSEVREPCSAGFTCQAGQTCRTNATVLSQLQTSCGQVFPGKCLTDQDVRDLTCGTNCLNAPEVPTGQTPASTTNAPTTPSTCCRCGISGTPNVCVQFSDVADCDHYQESASYRALNTTAAGTNPYQNITCTGSLDPTQCRPMAGGGVCATGPNTLPDLVTSAAQAAAAGTPDAPPPPFEPTVPKLNVAIPGLVVTPATKEDGVVVSAYLAQYLSAVYRYMIGVAVLAAIIMVIYGGFRYMMGAIPNDIKTGKTIIMDAIGGLLIALGGFLIINTINPNALEMSTLKLGFVENIPFEFTLGNSIMETPTSANTSGHMPHWASCSPQPIPSGPLASSRPFLACVGELGLVNVNALVDPSLRNKIRCTGSLCSASTDLKVKLDETLRALSVYPNRTLEINSINRLPIDGAKSYIATAAACGKFISGGPPPSNSCGLPGGAPPRGHGGGRALDLKDAPPCCMPDGKPFAKFMEEHGWMRYCPERWHYELATDPDHEPRKPSFGGTTCWGGGADGLICPPCRAAQ